MLLERQMSFADDSGFSVIALLLIERAARLCSKYWWYVFSELRLPGGEW